MARISPYWSKIITHTLVAAGVVWVVSLLYQSRAEFLDSLENLDPAWLAAGLLLGLLGAATRGETFYLILRDIATKPLPRIKAYRLQYIAALARNLPGRFWGIAYQIAETRQHLPASSLLLAQSFISLMAVYFTLGLAIVILLWANDRLASTAMLGLSLPVFLACLHILRTATNRLISVRGQGRLASALNNIRCAIAEIRTATVIRAFLLAGLGWGLYLGGWALIGIAHPSIGAYDGLRLAAFYSLAWLLGFLTLITPSGLGVRELSFLFLANSFSADVLALSVILGRLWLLMNDLVLGLVVITVSRPSPSN